MSMGGHEDMGMAGMEMQTDGHSDMNMGNMTMAGLTHETLNEIDMYQYGFAVLVDLFILGVYPIHFYQWFRYPDRRIAFSILVNMITWVVTAAWNLAYSINSLLAYGKEDLPVLPIFWLGSLYFSGIIAISLSVFLLMVDRCAVLLFPARSPNSFLRNVITLALVTLQYLIFILVLYLYEFPTKTVAQCSVIDCVAAEHAESLNATKIGYGFLNSALAVFFGILMCRYNNTRRVKQNNTRKTNIVIGLNVLIQLGFNFVPSLINFISHKSSHNHDMTSNSAGPLVSTLAQIDGLLTALLYMSMLTKHKKGGVNKVTTVRTAIEKMPPPTTSNTNLIQ
ncbi:hypothetical protein M3Y97_00298700 [Aphelenchoides bicaudatus]|nr:hypothetical protein M3Y97_00298700 [Aphelenchoides bicaudatus]